MSSKPGTLIQIVRNDYSSTNVTTGAYVELVSALGSGMSEIDIFDSSGNTMILAYGAAGSEVDWMHIMPGGNGRGLAHLPEGVRLSVKAVSANSTSGELTINIWG